MGEGIQSPGVPEMHRNFPTLARGLVLWFWDTLAFNGYPVAVGVVDWLVGDESNRSSVDDEHRVIENIGS